MWEGYPYFPLRKDFPLAGKSSEMPEIAFSNASPMAGGPFVTVAGGRDATAREPRVRLPETDDVDINVRLERRRALWREQLLTLQLFRTVYDVAQRSPDKSIDRDFVLETIITRMPYEDYERIFNTFVRWSRFGELFRYAEAVQQITLVE